MIDRPIGGDAAVLVSVDFGEFDYQESLQELTLLAVSAGLIARATIQGKRIKPDAKYFIGSGKAEELSAVIKATESKVAVFNHDLSPSQQRNLERLALFDTFEAARTHAEVFPIDAISPFVEIRDGKRWLMIQDGFGYPVLGEPIETADRG